METSERASEMPNFEKGDGEFIASTLLGFVTQDEKTSIRNIVLWPLRKLWEKVVVWFTEEALLPRHRQDVKDDSGVLPPRPDKGKGKYPGDELLDNFMEALLRKQPGDIGAAPQPWESKPEDKETWKMLVNALNREHGAMGESSPHRTRNSLKDFIRETVKVSVSRAFTDPKYNKVKLD